MFTRPRTIHIPHFTKPVTSRSITPLTNLTPRFYATITATMTDPSKYKLNHSMLRVKDPARSIAFYNHLGMQQINKIQNPDAKFDRKFRNTGRQLL